MVRLNRFILLLPSFPEEQLKFIINNSLFGLQENSYENLIRFISFVDEGQSLARQTWR